MTSEQMPTTPPEPVVLDLDALEAAARAQIVAIDQMDEVGRGVGGMTRPNLAAYMAWQDASDGYDHADTVLALIERLRDVEARLVPTADGPRVGQWAHHKIKDLNRRRVAEVNESRTMVRLQLLTKASIWLDASHYTFVDPTEGEGWT